jgi:hypothetical protein
MNWILFLNDEELDYDEDDDNVNEKQRLGRNSDYVRGSEDDEDGSRGRYDRREDGDRGINRDNDVRSRDKKEKKACRTFGIDA